MEFDFTQAQYDAIVLAERVFEFLVVGFALWRGDRTVRVIALVFLAQAIGEPLVDRLNPVFLPTRAFLLVDVPALVVLLGATVRAPRPWVLWICAFKLMLVATHVARLVDPDIGLLAYSTAANAWILAADGALLFATLAARRGATPEQAPA